MSLPPPVRYPYHAAGPYSTAPALRPLGTDFGNGEADRQAFIFDADWPRFQASKEACRPRLARHVGQAGLDLDVHRAAFETLAARLASEHPSRFTLHGECLLVEGGPTVEQGDLDGLGFAICEDFAIVQAGRCAYVHICSPSHWDPIQKLGLDFRGVHGPVPHMERTLAGTEGLLKAMQERGPWVRFVWTLEPDDHLNHHPDLGDGARRFDGGRFWVRVERQTTLPLLGLGAFVFLIRVTFVPDHEILAKPGGREELLAALDSLPEASRTYKGLPEASFAQARNLVANAFLHQPNAAMPGR